MAKTTPKQKQRIRKALGGAAKVRKIQKKHGVQPKKPKYAKKNQAAKKKRVVKRKIDKMTGGRRSKSKSLKNKRAKKTRVANRKYKKLIAGNLKGQPKNWKNYVSSKPQSFKKKK